jgi:hypothetical protein
MVIPEHGRLQLGRIRQIGIAGAKVDSGGDGGVVDVIRVRHAVTVAIDAIAVPGGGDELHRAHRTVPHGVAV